MDTPGGQTAPANGHQDDVYIGQILKDLIGDGALPGGNAQIIEGMHVGEGPHLGRAGGPSSAASSKTSPYRITWAP